MNKMLMRSKAAISRLRAYKPPPFPTWDHLPLSRRAAVLVLLFADREGDLRVVITMRAASLRSFSGKCLLPAAFSKAEEDGKKERRRLKCFCNRTCSISRRQGGLTSRNTM